MTCLRKMILFFISAAVLLSINAARAVSPDVNADRRVNIEYPTSIKKNLNTFFLIDVSESMRPFADCLKSFNRSFSAMEEKGIGLGMNRVYAYWDSTASDRDMTVEPNFLQVKGLESLEFAHKSGDRNCAEPLFRAFKKVLDEIELLQNERLILPLHEKLLFIITDAGPNDLTDQAFSDIVARAAHLNLLVYFVYPSRHGVRNPSPRLDDNPADAYNLLKEMIARFEKSSSPGQTVSFRRFQVEAPALQSQTRCQDDFNRQLGRILEGVEAYIDHAKIERERAAATYAGIVSELKPGQWEAARSRLYANQGLFAENLVAPQREQMTALMAFFTTLEEGDRLLGESPRTIEGIDQALTVYGKAQAQAQATELLPVIDVGFIAVEKSAAATDLQAALRTQQQLETALSPRTVDSGAEIKQAMSLFDEKNYTEAFSHFSAVYGSQINNLQQREQRQVKGLLSLPPKYRAEIIFLIEFERIRKKNNNDRDRIKMGLEDLLQDIENRQGPWVLIPEIRRERIKKHINEFK